MIFLYVYDIANKAWYRHVCVKAPLNLNQPTNFCYSDINCGNSEHLTKLIK